MRRRLAMCACLVFVVLTFTGCVPKISRSMVEKKDLTGVRAALQKGASPNWIFGNGMNPFLYAVRSGDLEMVRLLVDHGADIQSRNQHGWSGLMIASRYGYPEIVSYLIEQGAFIHTANYQGYTPLMLTAFGGHVDIMKILVAHDVRVNVPNEVGKTALYYAALNGREAMVRYLLDHDAKVIPFEDNGEALYATAFAYEIRASMRMEDQDQPGAVSDLRSAAEYYGKAAPGFVRMAEGVEQQIEKIKRVETVRIVFTTLLGLVAVHADLQHVNAPNPWATWSGYVSQEIMEPAAAASTRAFSRMAVLQQRADYFRQRGEVCRECCASCRDRAEELSRTI